MNNISTEGKQFYSQRAIGIATFFGGPLAAGILVRKNYINLGNEVYGKHSLFLGILTTLLLFLVIFSLPEHLLDKIPNSVLPAIYTVVIYLFVDRLQGKELNEHKQNNGAFHSTWKATGIGVACMFILVAVIFLYGYTSGYVSGNFDNERYDKGIVEFQENEQQALQLFHLIDTAEKGEVLNFINKEGLSNWETNISILNKLDKIEGLPADLQKQNKILREYCSLRIKMYKLIEKAVIEETDQYSNEIDQRNKEIEALISEL